MPRRRASDASRRLVPRTRGRRHDPRPPRPRARRSRLSHPRSRPEGRPGATGPADRAPRRRGPRAARRTVLVRARRP
ncbi:hypothetical protein DZF95_08225 [Clavibacter michiganensis]|nr:hypothetical protein DZF95_08225 [Clavibacter michiganensis]